MLRDAKLTLTYSQASWGLYSKIDPLNNNKCKVEQNERIVNKVL